nr:MAG TPA: hypothetical protein [Caudoviricetes sp.]
MFRPLQPQFKIRVFNGKRVHLDTLKGSNVVTSSDENYIDIEPCVAFPVTYEEQASLLNTLQFTVDKNADLLLYYFYIGQSIIFYGGYYADNQSGMRHVFSGTVTRIRTHFSDNGTVSFTVECMNYGFTKLGKDFKNFVYPDKNSSRKFAQSESLTLSEIIIGIAKENNFEVGEIDLSSEARSINFDKVNIRYQKNVSDWKFLTMLAQDFGCTVWLSTEDGVEKLNFMSKEKAYRKQQSDITFLFPLYGVTNENLHWNPKILDTEWQTFDDSAYNRPRILRDVTVDEDISQAYAVTRSAVYFDKETGQEVQSMAKIETKDGKNYIVFYELDEKKVEYVHRTMPEIADKIRDGSPTSMEWGKPGDNNPEHANYYYTAKRIYDEQTAVFDKAFLGITVTAKCNQDLSIRSQRSYKIRGLLLYRTESSETTFLLRGLKHIWDADGTWTELDFIR